MLHATAKYSEIHDLICRMTTPKLIYVTLLKAPINYVHEKFPQHPKYLNLISILGNEIDIKEAAAIIGRQKNTLYGWLKKLRPIFNDFIETTDFL